MLMWKSVIRFIQFLLVFYHLSMFKIFYIIYFSGSTISGWKSIVQLLDLVGAFQRFPIWKLYRVKLDYIDILKLKTYE